MNFSARQWWVGFALDVVIKAALLYFSAVLISLGVILTGGIGPAIPFVLIAVSISGLYFLCLFFGERFVAWLGSADPERRHAFRPALVLIFTNVLFVVSFTVLVSATGNFYDNVILSMILTASNLPAILLVAAARGLAGRLKGLR